MKTITKKAGDFTFREVINECRKHDVKMCDFCPFCHIACWPLMSPDDTDLDTEITLEVEE